MTTLRDLNGSYTIDPAHTVLGFVVRHAMISKVRGHMSAEGKAEFNGSDPKASSIEVTADVASISTGNEGRDAHLSSADFFDAEKYPTISFVSTDVNLVSDDKVEVTGNLTIKDVTRPLTLPMEFQGQVVDPFGAERVGFEGRTKINRTDYGLNWNAAIEAGGVLVGEQVTLELEVELVKQA